MKKAVIDQLDGQAGWRVVSVNQNGVDVDVLHEVAGVAGAVGVDHAWTGPCRTPPSMRWTPRRQGDDRGDQAVDRRDPRRSRRTRPPTPTGLLATTGLYPPGSTFKMVTAGAAVDRDMATPNTMLGCPGHIDIGHRTIPNYGGFDLGVVPMSRAFASSCNTTFAELGSQDAAARSDAGGQPATASGWTIRSTASPR